jgi:hypothetical protein
LLLPQQALVLTMVLLLQKKQQYYSCTHIRFFFLFCNYMFCCNQIVAPDHMNNIKSFYFSIFFIYPLFLIVSITLSRTTSVDLFGDICILDWFKMKHSMSMLCWSHAIHYQSRMAPGIYRVSTLIQILI